MGAQLERTAFTTDRALEFFTESELTTQIGYGRELWPVVLVKELVDNSLDAAESARVAPVISVRLEPDALTVTDNGPGIPASVIEKSLNYTIRVSDKKNYVSPTQGQLGNALKCVWAAPFAQASSCAPCQHTTSAVCLRVTLDRIAQKPIIDHTTECVIEKAGCWKVPLVAGDPAEDVQFGHVADSAA